MPGEASGAHSFIPLANIQAAAVPCCARGWGCARAQPAPPGPGPWALERRPFSTLWVVAVLSPGQAGVNSWVSVLPPAPSHPSQALPR